MVDQPDPAFHTKASEEGTAISLPCVPYRSEGTDSRPNYTTASRVTHTKSAILAAPFLVKKT